ncbi:MAG: hypothetical protein ABSH08_13930 [Tepidisphaeraceae bacterium]|jgi:hypothetical protein
MPSGDSFDQPKRNFPRRHYVNRHVTLPPADDDAVVAHAEQNGISYSRALSQIVEHHGRLMGASANQARIRLRELGTKIEAILDGMKSGRSPTVLDVRALRDLNTICLEALG